MTGNAHWDKVLADELAKPPTVAVKLTEVELDDLIRLAAWAPSSDTKRVVTKLRAAKSKLRGGKNV